MYLSSGMMNRLNPGQRQAMHLIAYIDNYVTGEEGLVTCNEAIQAQLAFIRATSSYDRVNDLAHFEELFEVHEDGLYINVDKTKELCQLLREHNP